MKNDFSDFSTLDAVKNHPVSAQIDQLFRTVIKEEKKQKAAAGMETASKVGTTDSPTELAMDELGELDINLGGDDAPAAPVESPLDEGLDLGFSMDESLEIGESEYTEEETAEDDGGYGDLSLGDEEEGLSLGEDDFEEPVQEDHIENLGELSFEDDAPALPEDEGLSLDGGLDLSGDEEASLDLGGDDEGMSLSLSDDEPSEELSLGGDEPSLDSDDGLSLNFGSDEGGLSLGDEDDLSNDAKEKLKEIDAIMDLDASQIGISSASLKSSENLDESLVSEDLDLGNINFGSEDEVEEAPVIKEAPKKAAKKKESAPEVREARDRDIGEDLKEIYGAYSGEMERMQATISNLRADREELLARIQKLEDEKVMQGRGTLTMRAELDERKIELTIIRKKLNEEINELKDRIKLFDEKRLILEEKNRILMQELDKAAQKNKIDLKKVSMRERELEQRLELLKSDAETQIRHRDLKILELKRKIDAMEFDMESISTQEKRSVESRFELEDKLEKAIKTLRSAITVLEDESDRSNALDALKKNIDM